MIIIKSDKEIEKMITAGKVTGAILYELSEFIEVGMSTMAINDFVHSCVIEAGMIPTFLGYNDFPASACVSVNEEVVHGIPSERRILKDGDIVSVDMGATYDGYVSDAARTYPVGSVSSEALRLIEIAKKSFFAGIECAKEGHRLFDISANVQKTVEAAGFSVVRDLVGHGVGRNMHEDPQVPNFGVAGKGPRLSRGMALAIEPMINMGAYDVLEPMDWKDWVYVTADKSLSAHYENTIIITEGEPIIATLDERETEIV